ncbi:FecR family protein [Sphingobacterium bovistauri]|uniref:FecR family protein n=1 Tax=Sphingobacterium bovistauri TaxID=2781959 RepID=A0ABS7Z644_9SPHI|nr:FecR family protein [Sphingobacterium bovistauri]MCA5005663.1 FecR family protein [Sphingobacterium bovistauri]
MHHIDKITHLLKRHFIGSGNIQADKNELLELLERHPELNQLLEELKDPSVAGNMLNEYDDLNTENQDLILESILEKIREKPSRKHVVFKIIIYAAACILLLIGFYTMQNYKSPAVKTDITVENFIAGQKGALLKLANGTTIPLNGDKQGIVTGEGITYEDGTKLLSDDELQSSQLLTLLVPNGKEFQITLSDGTKVFLNAGSELTYPIKFTQSTRNVQLKGEAYFDVKTIKTKPFLVKTPTQTIEVLGTQFNVNEYSNTNPSVTLVEGSVEIETLKKNKVLLTPNQHATNTNGTLSVKNVDVSEYIAWKNGEFLFNYEKLSTAMEKIKRWYDIDIKVDPNADDIQLWGSIKRKENFTEVLKLIKLTNNNLKININGRKVTVTR